MHRLTYTGLVDLTENKLVQLCQVLLTPDLVVLPELECLPDHVDRVVHLVVALGVHMPDVHIEALDVVLLAVQPRQISKTEQALLRTYDGTELAEH